MDNLTLQIKTVCLVSILTGIMSVLVPSGRLKKAFNSFCAVVIIFSVMLPFTSLGRSAEKSNLFDFSKAQSELLSQSSSAEQLVYTSVVEKALNDRLTEMKIKGTVRVQCEKEGDGFSIVSFTVTADTDEDKDKISAYLTEGFNGIPIYFKEEKDG